jgi:hypothetical protein
MHVAHAMSRLNKCIRARWAVGRLLVDDEIPSLENLCFFSYHFYIKFRIALVGLILPLCS